MPKLANVLLFDGTGNFWKPQVSRSVKKTERLIIKAQNRDALFFPVSIPRACKLLAKAKRRIDCMVEGALKEQIANLWDVTVLTIEYEIRARCEGKMKM